MKALKKNDLEKNTQSTDTRRPAVSVIIAVYNKPDFLEKILESLKNQSFASFEVVVADDGSGPEIQEIISRYQDGFSFPIQHIWHEDKGFRKTIIANKAVLVAKADYLVFIDGDSICHHRFIESHFKHRKLNTVLSGRRIMLDEELTKRVTLEDVRLKRLEKISYWANHCERADLKHGFFVPILFFLENFFRIKYSILGCNFSVHKNDYCSVNGYDERIIGRGMEDSNLDARFKLKKIKIKTLTRQALQYHLFHHFDPVPHSPEAIQQFCFPKEFWTEHGISKDRLK
jgi:Glycosyltransferases, probably involved in cell wall biogenesis